MSFSPAWFLVGLVFGVVLLLAQLFSSKALVLSLAAIVLLNIIGLPRDWLGNEIYQWLYPLQVHRTSFIAGMVPTILVGARSLLPLPMLGKFPSPLLFLIANYVYIGLLRIGRVGPVDGVLTVALPTITIVTIWTLVHRLSEEWEDFVIVPRAVAIAMAAFLGLTSVQWVINADQINSGNTHRFIGVAGNPQFVAVMFGLGLVMVVWASLYDRRRLLLAYAALAVPSGVVLLATGSRTGLMMCILGLCLLAIRRFGRMILLLPLFGFAFMLMIQLANAIGLDLPFERFIAGGDTRGAAWNLLITKFMSSPIVGVGRDDAQYSENGFLLAAAAYGLPSVLLLIGFTVSCVNLTLQTYRQAARWPSLIVQSDLIIGCIAAYFAGTILEGYIVGRVNAALVLITAIIATAEVLRAKATALNEDMDLDQLHQEVDEAASAVA